MDGPVAIITGAGRGIGRAVAVELGAAGYRLTLVLRNQDELNETARLAGGGLVVVADVKRPDDVQQIVEGTVQQYDGIDAIVHCAGIAPVRSIGQMTVEEWHDVINTNLSAAFYLCRSAWHIFERQHSGVVVNVSSEAARDPFPGFAAYGAAKAGINLFGLSAAREGQKDRRARAHNRACRHRNLHVPHHRHQRAVPARENTFSRRRGGGDRPMRSW